MDKVRSNFKKRLIAFFVVAFGSLVLGLAAFVSGIFSHFENATWDLRVAVVAKHTVPDPKIRLITIDQSSLNYFAKEERIYWPWPRAMYEPMLRFLKHAQARVVGLDILFTEPSSYGVEDDAQFAQAIESAPPVVLAASMRDGVDGEINPDSWNKFRKIQLKDQDETKRAFLFDKKIRTYSSALLPIEPLLNVVSALGNVSAEPDSDKVFRHTSAGGVANGVPLLSFPFAVFNFAHSNDESIVRARELSKLDGRLAVRFAGGSRTYKTDPIAAVIQSFVKMERGEAPLINPADYKDAIVLVGMDAPGLLDLRATPLAQDFPGVEYNATVVDNLLSDSFFYRPSLIQNLEVVLAFACGLAMVVLFAPASKIQVALIGLLVVGFIVAVFEQAINGMWVPLVVPMLIGLVALLFCFVFQFQLEWRQHRFLRHAFRHYVSGDVVDQIVENPASLAIGGERRELSIFFSDIEGFTKISERLEVSALVQLLNEFFSEMSSIIMKSGGTVDKYVGDAIVAFWNAPLECGDHAQRAVKAAVECQKRLGVLRKRYLERFGVEVRMRIGIHTGTVNVGNFGSRDRFNYTMIGDAANLASRLEGANKYFGTFVMVSEATRRAVGDGVLMREVGEILVVGKQVPTRVYEPIAEDVESRERSERFEKGREAFVARRFEEAQTILHPLMESDPVARKYIERIEREKAREGPGFNAVFVLADK